jgi:hypothetical protein
MIIKTNKEELQEYNRLLLECIELLNKLPDHGGSQGAALTCVAYAPIHTSFNVTGAVECDLGHTVYAPISHSLDLNSDLKLRRIREIISPLPHIVNMRGTAIQYPRHLPLLTKRFATYSSARSSADLYSDIIYTGGKMWNADIHMSATVVSTNPDSTRYSPGQRIQIQCPVILEAKAKRGRKLSELIFYVRNYNDFTINDLAFYRD